MKIICLIGFLLCSCSKFSDTKISDSKLTDSKNSQSIDSLKKYFDEFGVKGSIVIYDLNQNTYTYYDSTRCKARFTPASTFKIPNSLIGLETGVITDENFVIKWDGVKRREEWDRDMDLKTAIKVSCVPYYQELARRVGIEKMQKMVNDLNYGNMDISSGVDKFWLEGSLKISQMEQIEFLKKLYKEELPVSRRSMDIVKSIIVLQDTLGYILKGKTGYGFRDKKDIGWLVGWVEKKGNVYFYATNIESEIELQGFAAARRKITENILRELKILN